MIIWSSDTPGNIDQKRLCNAIPEDIHTVFIVNAKNIEKSEDAFDLLFDKDILTLIWTKSNERVRKTTEALTKHKEHLLESWKYPWIKSTDVSESRALVGLLYYHGFCGMNYYSINILFSDKADPPIFIATLSCYHMKSSVIKIDIWQPIRM